MAYKYQKSDMVYKDYKETAYAGADNPKVTGVPDSTLFNRHELYEVLYLINHFGVSNKAEGQKLEKLIREKLPSSTRSQAEVHKWLKANL